MDHNYPPNLRQHIGQHKLSLPSPSLCISLPTVKNNAAKLHKDITKPGVTFRAHLKTNKTTEITRIMLGKVSTKVAISTLREIHGLESLIADGTVQDILYAIPVSPSILQSLDQLSYKVKVRLMVDHIDQLTILNNYSRLHPSKAKPWSLYIKLDLGSKRAGVRPDSSQICDLMEAIESSSALELYGIYSYPARMGNSWSFETARSVLQEHVKTLKVIASLRSSPSNALVLAVGSSITARVVQSVDLDLPPHSTLEIVAGTTIYNDLQQLATGTVSHTDLAMTVVAEVCSIYEQRNEALINAGVLALTREPGDISGIARVRGIRHNGWVVGRVSQEHGILTYTGSKEVLANDVFKVGDKVELDVQHTCIVGAMYGWHFVTDEDDIVRDVYLPWKWW